MSTTKKNNTFLIATVIILLLFCIGGGYWFFYARHFESTNNAYLQSDIITIRTKVSGYIKEDLVVDNQQVKAGQLLARIDPRDLIAEENKAYAAIQVNKATIVNLIAQLKLQKIKIFQAKTKITSAQADLERIKQTLYRTKMLFVKNYASQDDLDDNNAHLKVAKASLAEMVANHAESKEQIDIINTNILQAKAILDESKTVLAQSQLNLSYTNIYSPIDAIVGSRSLRKGALLQVNSPLLSLVPLSEVWIDANFKETQLLNIKKGQKVDVELDAYPNLKVQGSVDSIGSATGAQFSLLPPENATGNFTKIVQRVTVKIKIQYKKAFKNILIPGLSAVVTIDTRG